MHAIRWLGAGVVAALATCAVYGLAWQPFRCNIVNNRVQSVANEIFDLPNTPTVVLKARQGIADMQRCIETCPTDVDMYMTLAAHDRVIGRLQHAAAMYGEALKYDRRPELFLNLGIVQLQMNQRQAAILTLTKAFSFNYYLIYEIPDMNVRDAVVTAAYAQRDRAVAEARRK